MSCGALGDAVEHAFSPDYIRDCQAIVSVRDYKSKKVHVYGQVPRPGTYYLKTKPSLRVVLSEAGGVTQAGNAHEVIVVRHGEQVARADLNRLLTEGDLSQDLTLEPGDTIFVPFDTNNQVHIIGQVYRPGPVLVDANEHVTLLKVISKSGGPTERADLKNAVLVKADGSKVPLRLDELINRGRTEFDMELSRGDTVLVPEELENQVYVLGAVQHPGLYAVRGRVTAVHALSLAGGPDGAAATSKTKIIRRGDKEPMVQKVDLTKVLGDGDVTLDVELQPRDIVFVPRTKLGKHGAWINQFLPTLSAVLGIQQSIVFTRYLMD